MEVDEQGNAGNEEGHLFPVFRIFTIKSHNPSNPQMQLGRMFLLYFCQGRPMFDSATGIHQAWDAKSYTKRCPVVSLWILWHHKLLQAGHPSSTWLWSWILVPPRMIKLMPQSATSTAGMTGYLQPTPTWPIATTGRCAEGMNTFMNTMSTNEYLKVLWSICMNIFTELDLVNKNL